MSVAGIRRVLLFVLVAGLSACAGFAPKIRDSTLRADTPVLLAPEAAPGAWPDAQWWHRYHDPVLDQLMQIALARAPSLTVADARFAAARQSVRVTGAATGVQIEASATWQRQRLSDNGLFGQFLDFNWYNQADLGLSATYSFDWWGKQRASIAAAVKEVRAAEAERSAAALLLSASIADTYFGWVADQQRLQLARERVATVERQALVISRRIEAELESGAAASLAALHAAAAREQIAVLEGSARMRIVVLAALLGCAPEELPPLVPRELPAVTVDLPANLRIDLIARRPEIAASRARIEAARSNLVVARAEYFPDISVHALAGLSSLEIGKLLEAGSAVPAFGAAVHLPLFDSGLRKARFGAREAQLASAIASYDEAIVAAARETGTAAATSLALAARRGERERQVSESTALATAAAARVRAGTSDIRPQLDAQLDLNAERDALLQLDAAAVSADIALQRALGGGYLFQEVSP